MTTTQVSITDLIYSWLERNVDRAGLNWLDEKRSQIAQGASVKVFFTAFSATPRYTGKKSLQLTPSDLQAAANARKGWFPIDWSVDRAARILLVLSLPQDDESKYLQTLEQVFTAADIRELVALYQALPLLSYPERLKARAAEGVRSNMTDVFNAVALQNPYPAEYFNNLAWNQMILKALFIGSPLHLIQGLDRRANPELAKMLVDYARERKAANRSISPELWELVKPFADVTTLANTEQAIAR